MDGQRFDQLARSLTAHPSRRTLVGGLAGGVLGGILNIFGLDDAAAQQRPKKGKKKCPPSKRPCGKQCCPKRCPKGRVRCRTRCCPKGQICRRGKCVRPAQPAPGCTPVARNVACAGRECGTVPDGCGSNHTCGPRPDGSCPGNGVCSQGGQCNCTRIPEAEACEGVTCGQASDGCGGTYNCSDCDGCCDNGTCRAGTAPNQCGHSGGICRACNPEVACVNGECTCTRNSCASGCCRIVDGQPFCDNDLRPCGDTCIPKTACCFGGDNTYPESVPGCRPNETCVVNGVGFGECRCGTGGRCQRNQGCCTLNGNGQPFCDTTARGCGDTCQPREQCCYEDEPGCDDGVSCTTLTCAPANVGQNPNPGYCRVDSVEGVCVGACAAGKGYGNYYPANQREVICGRGVRYNEVCHCWRTMNGTAEGSNVCAESVPGNIEADPCRTNDDCGTNEVCIRSGMAGIQHTCAPICGMA